MYLVFQIIMLFVLLASSPDSDGPTFSKTVKNMEKSVGQAAKTAGDNAWTLSKDTNLYNQLPSPLGPETEVAVETSSDQSEGTVSEADETSCPSEGCDDLRGHKSDVSVVEEKGVLSQLYDIASSSLSTVYTTATKNIYDSGAELKKNITTTVREVMKDELKVIIQTLLSDLRASLFTPGTTLYYLGQVAMTSVLVIICLFFSWMFLSRVSLSIILGGNAFVCLLHQSMGSQWIFNWLFIGLSQFTWILHMTYTLPYIASVLCLVTLFVYFIVVRILAGDWGKLKRVMRKFWALLTREKNKRLRKIRCKHCGAFNFY